MTDFNINDFVRLIQNPLRSGVILGFTQSRGRHIAQIQFADGMTRIPIEQLELVPKAQESALDLIQRGIAYPPESLRKLISHVKLSGRLIDMFYSMENSNTKFFAHQFKPVIKMLNSPTDGLLVADEVGLGKTIEAGLVWTEIAARYQAKRLLVICPKVLCLKWQTELQEKFGLDARIFKPDELHNALDNTSMQQRGFIAICAMQSIRPRPEEKRTGTKADKLAELLESIEELDHRLDMLIIDEAHHLRNPTSQTYAIGPLYSKISAFKMFLSATPINLKNRDLFSLLQILDRETFADEQSLEEIINANAPLMRAKDALFSGQHIDEIYQHVLDATRTPLLKGAQSLTKIKTELLELTNDELNPSRAEFINRLENVNLLANVVNRTRRRDVEELRVVRQVRPIKLEMNPIEADVYQAATNSIIRHAYLNDLPTGFLTVTPQRMLASCLPAAVAHWRSATENLGYEDADNFNDQTVGPLILALSTVTNDFPSSDILEQNDTKFNGLVAELNKYFEENPDEKVIIFSTFRPTLEYLRKRLTNNDIICEMMHGNTEDRNAAVDRFKDDPTVRVFLSSEVGSEGIDLQFARCVINYDLPWNPMRVEQRIGRVDRLGQTSDSITVINIFHKDTIDDRIYTKLYERLKLCETALGGFEEILGDEIQQLTKAIFSSKLTEDEQNERIETTQRAIENRKKIEEELEHEAGSLIAHGDFVLQSILEARDNHRWISDKDIVDYLEFSLGTLYQGCSVSWNRDDAILDLTLTPEFINGFEVWSEKNKTNDTLQRSSSGRFEFQLGKGNPRSKLPKLSQSHPVMRFIAYEIGLSNKAQEEPIGASLNQAALKTPVEKGTYVGTIQSWKFGHGADTEKLGYSFRKLGSTDYLDNKISELLVNEIIENAQFWDHCCNHFNGIDPEGHHIEELQEHLVNEFYDEVERRKIALEDRMSIQLATLSKRAEEERKKLERIIANSPASVKAANEGRLRKLNERIALREQKIQQQTVAQAESSDVAILLVEIK